MGKYFSACSASRCKEELFEFLNSRQDSIFFLSLKVERNLPIIWNLSLWHICGEPDLELKVKSRLSLVLGRKLALRPNNAAGQNRTQSETGLDSLSLKCPFGQMMPIGFYGLYKENYALKSERNLSILSIHTVLKAKQFNHRLQAISHILYRRWYEMGLYKGWNMGQGFGGGLGKKFWLIAKLLHRPDVAHLFGNLFCGTYISSTMIFCIKLDLVCMFDG